MYPEVKKKQCDGAELESRLLGKVCAHLSGPKLAIRRRVSMVIDMLVAN